MSAVAFRSDQVVLLVGAPRSGLPILCDIFGTRSDIVLRCDPKIPPLQPAVPDICTAADVDRYREIAGDYVRGLAGMALPDLPASQMEATAIGEPAFAAPGGLHGSAQDGERPGPGRRVLNRVFGRPDPPPPPDPEPSGAQYGARYCAPGDRRLVIGSSGLLGRIPLFTAAVPGIRVILIIRNPFGYVAAMLRAFARDGREALPRTDTLLATPQARSYGLSENLFGSVPISEQLVWNWVIRNELAIEALADIPEWRIVRGKDLADDPASIAKALFTFTGLPWHPQTFIQKGRGEDWLDGEDRLSGEDWPNPHSYVNGFADPFVQAFEDMTPPLFGGTSHYGQGVPSTRRSHYGWESELTIAERQRILTLVRTTSLSAMYPELEDLANLV